MKKYGLLFPGQGSQYVGMGKEICEKYPVAKDVFAQADRLLSNDLSTIIFDGPEDTLRQTQYTQPAIFTVSMALYKTLLSLAPLKPDNCLCAGHSLGEYSALCACGAVSFEDGLKLVRARGTFIQEASTQSPGTMAAIIGFDRSQVETLCKNAASEGVCEAVNYNSPGQIVIAGTVTAINKAVALAQERGATKAVILNVSGPFHSSLMAPAADKMSVELTHYTFSDPVFPVLTNVDALPVTDGSALSEKLVRQVKSPVLWEDTIKKMITEGVDIFIEIGPQRVLSGLLRRIDKTKKALNIDDIKSLEKTVQELNS